jgi:hypothetical protein
MAGGAGNRTRRLSVVSALRQAWLTPQGKVYTGVRGGCFVITNGSDGMNPHSGSVLFSHRAFG